MPDARSRFQKLRDVFPKPPIQSYSSRTVTPSAALRISASANSRPCSSSWMMYISKWIERRAPLMASSHAG